MSNQMNGMIKAIPSLGLALRGKFPKNRKMDIMSKMQAQ